MPKIVPILAAFLVSASLFAQKPGALKAVEFDGTDDYIIVPDKSAMNPTSKITVEAWIKADAWGTSSFTNSIFCKHGWATGNKGYVLRCGDNGKVSFNISNASGAWTEAITGSVMKTGQWYHVAGTFNGDTIIVYINGNVEATTVYNGSMSPSTGLDAKIGEIAYTSGRFFKGQIDEVRMWNTALSKHDLRTWMCRKLTKTHPYYNNLGVYYKLDDGSGVSASDQSPIGNTATLTNGPKWVNSGAALADSSVFTYNSANIQLNTKFGDQLGVRNIIGSPGAFHTLVHYGTSEQGLGKNAISALDSTHFFEIYHVDNTSVSFDLNYNFKNLTGLSGVKKCGVNLLTKPIGNTYLWDNAPHKLYSGADSLVAKKQVKSQFSLGLYQTDSNKILNTNTGRNWFCSGDSMQLTANGNDSFVYTWYKNGSTMGGKNKRNIWVGSDGTYKVTLNRRGTSCSFQSAQFPISSKSTSVSWSFNNSLCENTDSLILKSGSPTGGYFSGKYVTGTNFYPKKAGSGKHTIYYNYIDSNDCNNYASSIITLLDTVALKLSPVSGVCNNSPDMVLNNVSPGGGTYSGKAVLGNSLIIKNAGIGQQEIIYKLANTNACISKSVFKVEVFKTDSLSVTLKEKACKYDEPINVAVYPKGGVLKGAAVIGKTFYPLFATIGYNWVYYAITDSHQCEVRDSARTYIADITKAGLNAFASICDNAQPFKLQGGIPADSGTYWLKGMLSDSLKPKDLGKGLYVIEYKIVNFHGCRDSASQSIRINASPLKPVISLNGNTLSSNAIKGNQWYDKSGPISGAINQTFKPLLDGIYFVKVVNDSNCSQTSDTFNFKKVGIKNVMNETIRILPNPSSNGWFKIESDDDLTELMVTDLYGRICFKSEVKGGKAEVDLSAYKDAYYILILKSNERSVFVKIAKM